MTKKGTVGHERQVSAATMSDAFLGEDSVLISTHSFDEGLGVKNDRCLIGVSCVGEVRIPYFSAIKFSLQFLYTVNTVYSHILIIADLLIYVVGARCKYPKILAGSRDQYFKILAGSVALNFAF